MRSAGNPLAVLACACEHVTIQEVEVRAFFDDENV